MIFAIAEVTPLTIDWKVLVVVEMVFDKIIEDVLVCPLTTEVAVLLAVLKELVVTGTRPDNVVVEVFPFTTLVNTPVVVA